MRADFLVQFDFLTPVAVGPQGLLPALDSLLAAAYTTRAGRVSPDPLREPAPIPLPLEALAPGLWAASLLWPLRTALPPQVDAPQAFARRYDFPQRSRRTGSASGPLLERMRQVSPLIVPRAVAFGRGDPDAVQDVLNTVRSIGAQRGIGFGQLAHAPAVRVLPTGNPHAAMVDAQGVLRRVVPLALASSLGIDPEDDRLLAYASVASVRLPLWYRPWWEPCLVPLPLTTRLALEGSEG